VRLAADANVLLSAVLGGRMQLDLESLRVDEVLTGGWHIHCFVCVRPAVALGTGGPREATTSESNGAATPRPRTDPMGKFTPLGRGQRRSARAG
jgi:hypothetical protein